MNSPLPVRRERWDLLVAGQPLADLAAHRRPRPPPRPRRARPRARRLRPAESFSSPVYLLSKSGRRGLRAARARGSEPGERGDLLAVGGARAVRVGVGLAALEEEVQVVLPGEADAAVDLQRGARDAPPGVPRVGLRAGGRPAARSPARGRAPTPPSRRPSARPRPRAASARTRGRRPGRSRSRARTACAPSRTRRPSSSPARPRRPTRRRSSPSPAAARALDVAAQRVSASGAETRNSRRVGIERPDRLDGGARHHRAVPVDEHVGRPGVRGDAVDRPPRPALAPDSVGAQQPGDPRRLQRRRARARTRAPRRTTIISTVPSSAISGQPSDTISSHCASVNPRSSSSASRRTSASG